MNIHALRSALGAMHASQYHEWPAIIARIVPAIPFAGSPWEALALCHVVADALGTLRDEGALPQERGYGAHLAMCELSALLLSPTALVIGPEGWTPPHRVLAVAGELADILRTPGIVPDGD